MFSYNSSGSVVWFLQSKKVVVLRGFETTGRGFDRGKTTPRPNERSKSVINSKTKKNAKVSIDDQKLAYFERFSVFRVYSIVVMVICILLNVDWLCSQMRKRHGFPEIQWSTHNMIMAPLYCIFILALLFIKHTRYHLVVNTLTAMCLVRCLISLETMFHRRESLVSFLIMIVIFRLMDRKSIYDTFGLCAAYTSDIVSINRKQYEWFYMSNLFVWTYYGVALLMLFVFRRLAFRVWEHIRVLVVLREKCFKEKQLGEYLIDCNMPDDMIAHLFPLSKKKGLKGARTTPGINIVSFVSPMPIVRILSSDTITSTVSTLTDTSTVPPTTSQPVIKREPPISLHIRHRKVPNGRMFVKHNTQRGADQMGGSVRSVRSVNRRLFPRSNEEERSIHSGMSTVSSGSQSGGKGTTDAVLRPAAKAKVLAQFTDAKQLNVTQLKSIGGMDRRETVLIAIKPNMSTFDSALSQLHFQAFIELIDYVASFHKVTRIRMFGNIWVGCIGVFQAHESPAVDCQHAVIFASEITVLAGEFYGEVSYAIEFGRILGGFLNSVHFDVFGQEIRWILMMIELKEYGKIALGDAAKKQLHVYRKQVLESNAFNAAMNRETINMSSVKMATTEPITKDQPWTTDSKITVNYVTNPWEMINAEEVNEIIKHYWATVNCKDKRYVAEPTPPNRAAVGANGTAAVPGAVGSAGSTNPATFRPPVSSVVRPRPLPLGLVYNPRPHLGYDLGESLLNFFHENILLRLMKYLKYSNPCEAIDVGKQSEMDWFKFQNTLYGDSAFLKILSMASQSQNVSGWSTKSRTINLGDDRTPMVPRAYRGIENRMSEAQYKIHKYSIQCSEVNKSYGQERLKRLFNNSNGLGVEFLTSVQERFGVSLNDSILDHMSEEDLIKAHDDIEAEVYRIIDSICFRISYNGIFLVNYYEDVFGRNEYATVRGKFLRGLEKAWYWCYRLCSCLYAAANYLINGPSKVPPVQSRYVEVLQSPASLDSDPLEMESSRRESSSVIPSFRSKPSPQTSTSVGRNGRVYPMNSPTFEMEEKLGESPAMGTPVNKPSVHSGLSTGLTTTASQDNRTAARTRFDDWYAVAYSHYKSIARSQTIANFMVVMGIEYRPDAEEPQSEEEEMKRSWLKYSGDVRLFTFNGWLNALISMGLTAVSWYSIRVEPMDGDPDFFWVFLLGGIHLILPIIVDRQYDRLVFTGLLAMCVFVYMFFPAPLICTSGQYQYHTSKHQFFFGDMGGDVTVLLFTAIRIAAYARHSAWQTILDWVVFRNFIVKDHCQLTTSGILMFFMFNLQIVILFQLIEYRAFFSYIVEHKLVAFAHKSYLDQMNNTRSILQVFNANVPRSDSVHDDLLVPQLYNNCLIVAIHIKAPDILSSIIEPSELAVIMKTIYAVIDSCIVECGMLKVTQFSGICVAVACKDFKWDGNGAMKHSESYKRRGMALVKRLEDAVKKFNERYEFNLALGMGINHGSVTLGLHGNYRHCFDVSGPAVDIACAMACFHGDKIFVRDFNKKPDSGGTTLKDSFEGAIEGTINRGSNNNNSSGSSSGSGGGGAGVGVVETVSEQTVKEEAAYRLPSGDWYLIGDNAMQGIGLNDFEHVKMLGRGGYGSVHLVKEKQTGENYAIKVIPLNAGPIIPKMITRECIILQMMQHPNVVSLECAFTHKEKLYLVMKYIRGGTLKEILEYGPDKGNIKLETKKLWFAELVLAIEYVHTMGIIHRDVKPANCMIGTDGHLRLADFGLSKKIGDADVALMNNATGVNAQDLEHMALRVRNRFNPIAESLGLTREAFFKIQKFLPLKLSNKPTGQIFKFLSVSPEFRADTTLFFHGFSVEIAHVQSIQDALAVVQEDHAAVCIEIDNPFPINDVMPKYWDYAKDGLRLVQEFFATTTKTPVFVVTKHSMKRKAVFINIGVKDFWNTPVENCSESHFCKVFGMQVVTLPASATVILDDRAATAPAPAAMSAGGGGGAVSGGGGAGAGAGTSSRGGTSSRFAAAVAASRVSNSKANSAVGTMHFIAPEVLKMSQYSKPVDWWACGVTIYECMIGEHLFSGDDRSGVVNQIVSSSVVNLSRLKVHGDAVFRLVQGLLQKDVRERLGTVDVESIKSQEFFRGIDWLTVSTSKPEYIPNTFEHQRVPGDEVLFGGDDRDNKTGTVADYKLCYDAIDQDSKELESLSGNQAVTRKQYARSNVNKYNKQHKSRLKQHHRTKQHQLYHAPASAAKTKLVAQNIQHNMLLSEEEFNRTREGMVTATVNANKIEEEDEKDVLEECSTDTNIGNHSLSLKRSPKSGTGLNLSHSGSTRAAAVATASTLLDSSMRLEDHVSEEFELVEKQQRTPAGRAIDTVQESALEEEK